MRCSRCHNMTDSDGTCAICGIRSSRPTLFGASGRGPGIFCPRCGSQNPPGWGYCGACGSANTARRRHEWLAGVLALLLALLALMVLGRAVDSIQQPVQAQAFYAQPEPIPTDTQTVFVSTISNGVSRSTEVVQSDDGATIVSSVTTVVPESGPNSVAPDSNAAPDADSAPVPSVTPDTNTATDPNMRMVSSAPAGPDATTGSMTYKTISAVN